jgi:N-acetylmuramate 1-kinase
MNTPRFEPERDAARAQFLVHAGWADARLEWRTGDASFRRYARLQDDQRRAMLMDAPPSKEALEPFLKCGAMLSAAGITTPQILAEDSAQGFLLLEDFGDATFTNLLDDGEEPGPLYALATDVLITIRQRFDGPEPTLPLYDADARAEHVSTFLDWLWPECMDAPPTDAERSTFTALWRDALQHAPTLGRGFVHRDFHVDNLMRLDDRDGVAACGVLDFQDAGDGPLAYDLSSLLEDARRDLPANVRAACLARYQNAVPQFSPEDIAAALAVHGGQRHCRVAGLWVRLWRRDGKPRYLKHMQRTLNHLDASLRHPAVADIRSFLEEKFPADARARAINLETIAAS